MGEWSIITYKYGMPQISGGDLFLEFINLTLTKGGNDLKVDVSFQYYDHQTKETQFSQYELILLKMMTR